MVNAYPYPTFVNNIAHLHSVQCLMFQYSSQFPHPKKICSDVADLSSSTFRLPLNLQMSQQIMKHIEPDWSAPILSEARGCKGAIIENADTCPYITALLTRWVLPYSNSSSSLQATTCKSIASAIPPDINLIWHTHLPIILLPGLNKKLACGT